jgi:hypothetical protein
MKIDENRLRQIIRSVIKESFEETGWFDDVSGDRVRVGDILEYFKTSGIDPVEMNIEDMFYKLSDGKETLEVITSEDRVNAANLDYPIIVIKRNGKIEYVLDGNHRLQKAKNIGEESIEVLVLDLDDDSVPEMYHRLF